MQLIDSHCHLDLLDLAAIQGDLKQVVAFAEQQGVSHFLCPGVTLTDLPKQLAAIADIPNAWTAVGLHPNETVETEPDVETLVRLVQTTPRVIALGETGLDYYRLEGSPDRQQERFRRHIRAAIQTGKPLIVHSRQAREDTIRLLKEENADRVQGVMHCFTEDLKMAQAAIALGFYISFSGIVTFSNAKDLQAVAKNIPLESMLIETDAPWLAPVPFRGKTNQPAYVRQVAEYIATLRNEPVERIAEQTTHNFKQLFSVEF